MEFDPRVMELAARVRLAVFDVDGVMTDGRIVLDGERETKHFHVRDGLGLVLLGRVGIERAVITGRTSAAVSRRMEELGIDRVFQGRNDKRAAMDTLLDTLDLTLAEVCYVGDDLPDLELVRHVGLGVAVADAHWKLREVADYRTRANGGAGAVREVCDLILTAQGHLDAVMRRYTGDAHDRDGG